MSEQPQGPKAVTGSELKAQIEAERLGRPFLVYRDSDAVQRILMVEEGRRELWIGRAESADIALEWDREVSGLHAQLELVGDECTVVDDGLSTNGSFVNEVFIAPRTLGDGSTWELLGPILIMVGFVVLSRFILPKLGVPT